MKQTSHDEQTNIWGDIDVDGKCKLCMDKELKDKFEQGYAKALDDAGKIIQTFNFKLYIADNGTFMYSAMKKALIAKLEKK